MKTAEFNRDYTLDTKAKTGIKAMPKNAPVEPEILTADGTVYDPSATYHFFDDASREVRSSTGFRRTGEYLCAFGLKIASVAALQTNRDAALADAQSFFKSEIENLNKRIADLELEKSPGARSLKSFLMAKE